MLAQSVEHLRQAEADFHASEDAPDDLVLVHLCDGLEMLRLIPVSDVEAYARVQAVFAMPEVMEFYNRFLNNQRPNR